MLRFLIRKTGPVIPIFYIDSDINQIRAANLLKKIKKFKYDHAKGIAIVCSIQNSKPVQVDKILQQFSRIKQKHNIPVYGFLLDQCTPESYYMTSIANQIYSLPSTVFQLNKKQHKISWDEFLSKYYLNKVTFKSNNNLNQSSVNIVGSTKNVQNTKQKDTKISERIFKQAVKQRISNFWYDRELKQRLTVKIPKEIPQKTILATDALNIGLIDNLGQHYQILKQKHPDCHFQVIKLLQKPIKIQNILIGLFILKVIIKWSIIFYIWLKHKAEGKSDEEILQQIKTVKQKY